MWAALFWTILVSSSAQVGEGVGFTPHGKVLRSLRGGARHGESGISVTQSTAWSPPWLAWRRRRGKAVETTSVSAPNRTAKRASPARGSTFNSALASIVGAILLGGGTLSLAPTAVEASPFDPRPPPKSTRQPFFEGWFIRWVKVLGGVARQRRFRYFFQLSTRFTCTYIITYICSCSGVLKGSRIGLFGVPVDSC